jgi:hypothetical protein
MNSFNPNYFIHAGNILLVVSYSVRDILWLRLFAEPAARLLGPTAQQPVGEHDRGSWRRRASR